ncbi:hypothetical protein BDV29DRAFT_66666 [Aspergillus leporis]|jgi:hypothetical protein|uniref:Uncharacterized protein n=1 Tax=Aspergillus leporis TaxID=41062 RepID=A0A5N5WLL2_9EURO|nr:hypothetical protein BDV29DRAFT_66666 [Aspergillus leporis]
MCDMIHNSQIHFNNPFFLLLSSSYFVPYFLFVQITHHGMYVSCKRRRIPSVTGYSQYLVWFPYIVMKKIIVDLVRQWRISWINWLHNND